MALCDGSTQLHTLASPADHQCDDRHIIITHQRMRVAAKQASRSNGIDTMKHTLWSTGC
jgi:hypothetical protein